MPKWNYTKGLHDLGNDIYVYLLPDGSWGWSNAGLVVDGGQSLLVDTLFDLASRGRCWLPCGVQPARRGRSIRW